VTSIESIRSSVAEARADLMAIMLDLDVPEGDWSEWSQAIYQAYDHLHRAEAQIELALVVE